MTLTAPDASATGMPEAELQARFDALIEADQRIAAQWPIARKVEGADYVVMTDGTFADTDAQVEALVRHLRERAF